MPRKCGMLGKGPFTLISILLGSMLFLSAVNPAIELFQQGEQRLNRGNLFGAIDLFKEALSNNPNYVQPLFGLSRAYFKLEEYEQALQYVQRARRLDRNNADIAALEGRIHTGLGQYEEAERIFQTILDREPNNLEAQFGLAELQAAMGNVENAISGYQDALESDPYNRRGLLSAALLHAAQDNLSAAAELIQTAVDSYPEDDRVHSIAADYYFKSDEIRKAEQHARQALQLDEESEEALYVLIRILFSQGRYSDAVETVEQNISIDRDDPLLWFLRANAFAKTGNQQSALDSFYTALDLQPSAEIARIALEEFLLEEYVPDSEERRQAAEVRFEYGQAYERDNRIELARQEYRRGLMLNPYSREGRVMYATTFKRSNNIGKYLSILEVLAEENRTTQEIRDEIEIYRSLREESVARSWDVDQFAIDRYRYRFALFTDATASNMIHLQSQSDLSSYMQGILRGNEHVEIVSTGEIDSFAEAFRQARATDVDFFVVLTYNEGERAFKAVATVYNASTGTVIRSFESLRTGNRRVSQALIRIAGSLAESLPLRGRIYRRQDDTVLLDVGSFQGVSPEDLFAVVRNENLELSDTKFSLEYSRSDILGQVEITTVDDLLSVGEVDTDQFFDLVNSGDAVVPVTAAENEADGSSAAPQEPESSIIPSEIYKSLLEIE